MWWRTTVCIFYGDVFVFMWMIKLEKRKEFDKSLQLSTITETLEQVFKFWPVVWPFRIDWINIHFYVNFHHTPIHFPTVNTCICFLKCKLMCFCKCMIKRASLPWVAVFWARMPYWCHNPENSQTALNW